MKKILCVFLVCVMCLGMCACSAVGKLSISELESFMQKAQGDLKFIVESNAQGYDFVYETNILFSEVCYSGIADQQESVNKFEMAYSSVDVRIIEDPDKLYAVFTKDVGDMTRSDPVVLQMVADWLALLDAIGANEDDREILRSFSANGWIVTVYISSGGMNGSVIITAEKG